MKDINNYIDHTQLKPDATNQQIKTLCEEAIQYNLKAVCVNPGRVKDAANLLADSEVGLASVVGFPLGVNTPDIKAIEGRQAVEHGASELDMVINIGALKDGEIDYIKREIMLVKTSIPQEIMLKVIIETCLLTDEEKRIACQAALEGNADFVKTSTGFSIHGASTSDVTLMKEVVGDKLGVKASGGIRSYEDAVTMISSGANRIGTSRGPEIITGGSKQ